MAGVKVVIDSPSRSLYGTFRKTLKRQLVSFGAKLITAEQRLLPPATHQGPLVENEASAKNKPSAEIALKIIELRFSTQGISRDETGRANEHEITAALNFQLFILDPSNQAQPESGLEAETIHSLSVTASYYQDFRNPIGGQAQLKETRQLLLTQLSQQLLLQIQYQLRSH